MRDVRIYRGKYSRMGCAHCAKILELGPKWLGRWRWCVWCQAPVCHRHGCTRCKRAGTWKDRPADVDRYEGWVMALTGQNLDRPTDG